MENNIAVSVICNAYNHERYIRDALEGFVMQQTSFVFEVLVHDDASTDSTADIIREYEAKYPDIIKPIYQTENQYSKHDGTISRLHRQRAKGKYIAFCEGDDYWSDPQKLQKQFDFMESHPDYSLCCGSTVWLDMRTGVQIPKCIISEDRDVDVAEIILEEHGRIFHFASMFIRREPWLNRPAWMNLFPVGDLPMEMHAALNGKVRAMADVMTVYRNFSEGSWTVRTNNDNSAKINVLTRMIEGLTAFNEATDGQYDMIVAQRIKRHRYNIAKLQRDIKVLLSAEMNQIYRTRKFWFRVSDVLACIAPNFRENIKQLRRNIKAKKVRNTQKNGE